MATVSLSNLMDGTIEVELYTEDDKRKVYISNDGSSGVSYEVRDMGDLHRVIGQYLIDNFLIED